MSEEHREKFLRNIATSNNRMLRLVERMLSLAKLESRTELLETSQFDLTLILEKLIDERQSMAEQAGVVFELPSQQTFVCRGDKVLLTQAIGNLLDNALRFSHPSSEISIRFETIENSGEFINRILIENRGEAIPDYAISKVFDRFFSLPKSGNKAAQSKSTGLGLSFVYEIMKLHKGAVTVENTNNGVSASLTWPTQR